MDLYIPLVPSQAENATLTPTEDEMFATYQFILNYKLMSWFMNSSLAAAGKKLFVSESGYPSSNKGMQQPWLLPPHSVGCTGQYSGNETAQAIALRVQFSVLSDLTNAQFFNGFIQFWYGNPGSSDYINKTSNSLWACGWTPVGKNATMAALRAAYSQA